MKFAAFIDLLVVNLTLIVVKFTLVSTSYLLTMEYFHTNIILLTIMNCK